MSKSYRKNYIETSSDFKLYYVTKVFTGWMYGITSPEAAALKQKSNHNELKASVLFSERTVLENDSQTVSFMQLLHTYAYLINKNRKVIN